MKKKLLIIVPVILCAVIIVTFLILNQKPQKETVNVIDIAINTDDDDQKIDWSLYNNTDYTLTNSITITDSGTYNLTGKITDGLITVNTSGNVKLVLNNVNITNSKGPAIYVKDAEDVVIELANGSSNYLEDGSTYSGFEQDEIGVIFSHSDITFQGEGTLEVKSNKEDGIAGKDDLKIISGNYKINSQDDGIRGKDSVYIQNGTFDITSLGDGIKSTNDTDTKKGYILIENGTFNINSELDAISAQTKLLIQDGTFDITTGGGSTVTSKDSGNTWGHWGRVSSNTSNATNNQSAKGIKSGDNLVIENGAFTLNTSDDSIHCNNYVGIKDGNFQISSGDDGIHADNELIIDSGTINITKSYEGIEAAKITINGGEISIKSSDDGVNVAGGNDSSSMGRMGENKFANNTNNVLTINGGTLYVDADGDGLDSNGSAYIYGGNIKVDGPTNSGNGALDYGGTFEVYGGTLLAGGANGMMQGCSSSSKIYNVSISFNSSYGENDIIYIMDSNGKEIASYKSSKTYSSLVIASPNFKQGETYTIKVNDTDYETFTISSITTNVGNVAAGFGRGGKGNMEMPDDNMQIPNDKQRPDGTKGHGPMEAMPNMEEQKI